jgi:hypothetical protein
MAESPRNPDPDAPQNPPQSVLNTNVRRSALWTYLAPLLVFFAGVGVVLLYWGTSPPPPERDATSPRPEGTTGTERERSRDDTPGGRNPDRKPSTLTDEIDQRAGGTLTELGEVFEDNSRGVIGRRIEVHDVSVERVESPTLLWLRDGTVRVAVVAPTGAARVQAGQSVNVVGTVERAGGSVRIRASRIELSQ